MNARLIFLLLLEPHLSGTVPGFICPTVSLLWTRSIANPHRWSSVIVAREAPTEQRKTSHMHRNRLVILEVALNHMNTWVQVRASIKDWICKCVDKLSVAVGTVCHASINLLWKIIWVCQIIHVFCLHVINYSRKYITSIYKGWCHVIAVETCFQFLGKSRI